MLPVTTKQPGEGEKGTSKPKDDRYEIVSIPTSGIKGDSWNRHNDHDPEVLKKIYDKINSLDFSFLENIK